MRPAGSVDVGDQLPPLTRSITQAGLVRYAGASGDFNPLHWDATFAAQVSPTGGVIAHGMLNMGIVSELVGAWAGGPEHIRALEVTFRKPCPVGTTITAGGEVASVDVDAQSATLAIWVEGPESERFVDRRRSTAVVALARS